ncbi:hypothetical protein MKX53_19310 [Psychrobacillus sp. FSL K6-4615]|uniref:hypothetical protein n=1 Tax=Psychrobacillus sp. FSL K6-4615 TaxID=2921551 RepID=UPI0030FB7B91
MTTMTSWTTDKQLEALTIADRFGELVNGHIRSRGTIEIEGRKVDVFYIALPHGINGYCPVADFRRRGNRGYDEFVGESRSFKITRINQEMKIVFLSEKEGSEITKQKFWADVVELDNKGELEKQTYSGTVTGYNRLKGIIYLDVQGQDCYMFRTEWSWERNAVVDVIVGETLEVKIQKFDSEAQVVRVSRRLTLPDPYEFVRTLKPNQVLVGRVVDVHKIHGIFVDIEDGVTLKAGKRRVLEEPDVGDTVRVRFQHFDEAKREGRVVILDYPGGKRKKKDLGSFLFG